MQSIKTILEDNDFAHIPAPDTFTQLFQKLSNDFNKNALDDIKKEDNKLRTYALLKTETGRERYLFEMKNVKNRTAFTKFRLSNHELLIEKGRHQNIDKELRFCPFCRDVVEDEIHFLLKCDQFKEHRTFFLQEISEENRNLIIRLSDLEKFKILMTDPTFFHHTAQFINDTMHVRKFVLEKHKNNE